MPPGRSVFVSSVLLTFGLAGCAHYQPAPLPLTSPLRESLAALRQIRPGAGSVATAAPLTAQNVADLAVINNPDLRAARAQHDVAQADSFDAGLPPDPVFTGGFEALIGGPGSIPSLAGSLTQDLSALVTYRVDQRAARAGAAQVDAGILWQEWQVASQATKLCIAIEGGQRLVATLQQDRQALATLNRGTAAQVTAGNMTIAASSSSLAALAATDTALDAQTLALAQDRDQLDALLGLQPGIAISVAAPEITRPDDATIDAAIATIATRRPDLIALRYGYQQADEKLRAAILSQFLPVSLGTNGGRDNSDVQSVGPSVTLTLPLFNRNRGNIAIATATRGQLAAQFSASLAGAAGGAQALVEAINQLQRQAAAADANAAAAAPIAAQARRAAAKGALDSLSAVTLQIAAADRQRAAISLHTQLATAKLSLITLLAIGLPPAAPQQLDHAAP